MGRLTQSPLRMESDSPLQRGNAACKPIYVYNYFVFASLFMCCVQDWFLFDKGDTCNTKDAVRHRFILIYLNIWVHFNKIQIHFFLLKLCRNGTASVVTSIFGGILQNEVNCLICGTESRKFDPFLGKRVEDLAKSFHLQTFWKRMNTR